jgi:hypothetical protein
MFVSVARARLTGHGVTEEASCWPVRSALFPDAGHVGEKFLCREGTPQGFAGAGATTFATNRQVTGSG